MLQRYQSNFAALTEEEAAHTAVAVSRARPGTIGPAGLCAPDGEALYSEISRAGLDQADVVMSMARDPSAIGVSCLEKIVGRPITRPAPKSKHKKRSPVPRKPRPELRDDRVIRLLVETNPKKPNSKSYDRFALYQDGMTVQEFARAGGTRADVKWDAERGYISVE